MRAGRRRRGGFAAAAALAALALTGYLAPVLATDRPLLARSAGGGLLFPAFADLPLLGRVLPREMTGDAARVLLRAPIPYSYRGISLDEALRPPGRRHPLGTDALGRDLLARLVHGARPTLVVGIAATGAALLAGLFLGALAGLRGGLLDLCIVRLADTVACFPAFVLALAFVAAAGGGIVPLVLGIALNRWTGMARFVRGEVLKARAGDLFCAARAAGAGGPRLVLRHLLPLLAAPVGVLGAFGVAHAIVLESSLSFVGFGIDPPLPSWGTMLAEARPTLDAAWWPVTFPALALLVTLASLCLVGDRPGGGADGAA